MAIVANNDVKYDTSKKRTMRFAQAYGEGVTWSVAQGTPSTAALKENPSVVAKKKDWLKRRDRESGDLYGMFPWGAWAARGFDRPFGQEFGQVSAAWTYR